MLNLAHWIYVLQLIAEAIRYGDLHKPTMERADFYLNVSPAVRYENIDRLFHRTKLWFTSCSKFLYRGTWSTLDRSRPCTYCPPWNSIGQTAKHPATSTEKSSLNSKEIHTRKLFLMIWRMKIFFTIFCSVKHQKIIIKKNKNRCNIVCNWLNINKIYR